MLIVCGSITVGEMENNTVFEMNFRMFRSPFRLPEYGLSGLIAVNRRHYEIFSAHGVD